MQHDPDVETVELEGTIKYRTAKAVLIDVGDGEEVWIPESQIVDEYEDDEGLMVFTIPEWLAIEKGLV